MSNLLRPANEKPRVCYCAPTKCAAPTPGWCIGRRDADWRERLIEAEKRERAEAPYLASPDGTVVVLASDLRHALARTEPRP